MSRKIDFSAMPETKCKCKTCQSMCEHTPCWALPEEAERLIEAGYGSKLMLEYRSRNGKNIDMLQPAIKGRESGHAPWLPEGRCALLTKSKLCPLHRAELKPLEGRVATCDAEVNSRSDAERFRLPRGWVLRDAIAQRWSSKKAQALVERWKKEFMK